MYQKGGILAAEIKRQNTWTVLNPSPSLFSQMKRVRPLMGVVTLLSIWTGFVRKLVVKKVSHLNGLKSFIWENTKYWILTQ